MAKLEITTCCKIRTLIKKKKLRTTMLTFMDDKKADLEVHASIFMPHPSSKILLIITNKTNHAKLKLWLIVYPLKSLKEYMSHIIS